MPLAVHPSVKSQGYALLSSPRTRATLSPASESYLTPPACPCSKVLLLLLVPSTDAYVQVSPLLRKSVAGPSLLSIAL